jgi:hypothetical protein
LAKKVPENPSQGKKVSMVASACHPATVDCGLGLHEQFGYLQNNQLF